MRSDPKISCTTAKHHALRTWAAICIVVVGSGVPMLCILWIRYLQRSAFRSGTNSAMTRTYWRGLGDPSTRFGWGGFYEMYRFAAPAPGTKLFRARGVCPLTAEELTHISSAVKLKLRLLDRLDAIRLHTSLLVAPVFESFIYVQKLLLLIVLNMVSNTYSMAVGHALIYAGMTVVVALVWPCRRLNVYLPTVVWVPHVPAKYRPTEKEMALARNTSAVFPKGFQKHPKRGWLWRGHVLINDVLNIALLFANLVPFINVCLVAIPSKAGSGVLQTFLIGLNCINIIITLGSWLFSIATWRFQAMELLRVQSNKKAAADGEKPEGEVIGRPSGFVDAYAAAPQYEAVELEAQIDGYDATAVFVAPVLPVSKIPPPAPVQSPAGSSDPALIRRPKAAPADDEELEPEVDGYEATVQVDGYYPASVPVQEGDGHHIVKVQDEGVVENDDQEDGDGKPKGPLTSEFDRQLLLEYGLNEEDILRDATIQVPNDKGYVRAMLFVMAGFAKASLTLERDPEDDLPGRESDGAGAGAAVLQHHHAGTGADPVRDRGAEKALPAARGESGRLVVPGVLGTRRRVRSGLVEDGGEAGRR